jgi:hypothetical protein
MELDYTQNLKLKMSSSENGKELSGFVKGGKFLD